MTTEEDSKRLAELGYKQELAGPGAVSPTSPSPSPSSRSSPAASPPSARPGTTAAPSPSRWGWPLISIFILIIGLCMSELVSAYPTAGGIYWWAATMGKPIHGWFTGWLNLIGLIAVTASVDYGCATFLNITINRLTGGGWDPSLGHAFLLFVIILVLHALINIFSHRLISLLQNISVWWHVAGAAVVVAILIFAPTHHQTVGFVFTEHHQQLRLRRGTAAYRSGSTCCRWASCSRSTRSPASTPARTCRRRPQGASTAAARGLWQSIFYSAIGGWILLLAFLFAATDVDEINKRAASWAPSSTTALPAPLATASSHLHDRPVLLRDELRDLDVPDDLRVLAGTAPSPAGGCGRRSTATGPRSTRSSRAAMAALITLPALYSAPGGTAGGLLRGRVDRGHRPLPGLPHPDLAPAADGRHVPARPVDARPRNTRSCAGSRSSRSSIISIYFIMPLSRPPSRATRTSPGPR